MLENKHRTAELYGFLPCEGTTILVIVFNLLDIAGRTDIDITGLPCQCQIVRDKYNVGVDYDENQPAAK